MNASSNALALAMFSGGLDSILAAKLIAEQGIKVLGLHFVTPFFGKPEKIPYWKKIYGLDIIPVDISEDFARLLVERPVYGFGSVLNPCVDCKITMLRHARRILEESGACCVVSGEVLGQRPMSQRRDTLNAIIRDSGLKGRLLRPLCALHLDPTEPELAGIIDRSKLLGLSGRGRKGQMELAKRFALKEIPTPAGGCRLTEQENARSYWPLLRHAPSPSANDFRLANTGRQYWHIDGEQAFWLIIGRNQADNDSLMELAAENDLLFKTRDFPGPVALGRYFGIPWPEEAIRSAAAFTASYSGKAVRHAEESREELAVRAHRGSLDAKGDIVSIFPARELSSYPWQEYTWTVAREEIRNERPGSPTSQEPDSENPHEVRR